MRLLCLAALLYLPFISSAQQNISLEEYKKKYPNEEMVQLDLTEQVRIEPNSTGLSITNRHSSKVLYLTDRAQQYAEKYITYSEYFQQISEVEAYTMLAGTKGYKKSGSATQTNAESVSDDFFYDDQREIKLVYPSLQAGAITEMNYTEKMTDPHHIGGFFFQKYMMMENAKFEISFPSSIKLKYVFRGDDKMVDFNQRTEGKNTIYTWQAKNIEKLPYESDAPSARHYMPHILLYIEEYTHKGKTVPVFSDVSRLHKWYVSLLKNVETKPDEHLKKITDSLLTGANNNYEKTKRIFYWVQDNIRYVAFEDGMAGLIPRQATTVCSKRYGDCKDMANLMVVMLNYAGIPAWHSWIGTRDIPYTYAQVPTGSVDNHMIAATELNGKIYFLDATGGRIPLGLPTPMIQGKETLVNRATDKHEVMKIAVVEKEVNATYDTTSISIQDDLIKGTSRSVYTGFDKYKLSSSLAYYNKEKQTEKFKEMLERGNNKCSIDALNFSGVLDRDSNLTADYSFTLPQYLIKLDNELYVNMNLDKPLKKTLIDTTEKKLDKEIDYKFVYSTVTDLSVPKGYNVTKLPANSTYNGKAYGYDVKYKKQDGKVFLTQTLYVDTLLLNRNDFDDWNKMIRSLQDVYRQSVVLKKI